MKTFGFGQKAGQIVQTAYVVQDMRAAIDWFERAVEVPTPGEEQGRALLYDLGDLLETVGETARALAVFLELSADAPGYRDVSDRAARLARVETEG